MSRKLVLRSTRVALPAGLTAASVHVENGRIQGITALQDVPATCTIIDRGDSIILPGLVDTHVHINEPGRAQWEGFETATAAAAAGGVTTLVDMPLNSVPATTTVAALEVKRAAAANRCAVDVAFWGGLVPDNLHELERLVDAGVAGFKCFLVPSGVAEFGYVDEALLRRALPVLARCGLPLLVHAEDPHIIASAQPAPAADAGAYTSWLESRPAAAEVAAVKMLVSLCRETGARIHVVHVSAAEVLDVLRAARSEGLPITGETCPHYLHFCAEAIPDGATAFKCAPPLRGAANRERLWRGLLDGDLDMIVSDHSPCEPALKQPGDFVRAWGGIASLQVGLSAVWAEARTRNVPVEDIVAWMATAPARLAGLTERKGRIAPGADADVVVWDPDVEWTVDAQQLHHRHSLTPWAGERLRGVVLATYLRGEEIYSVGKWPDAGRGRLLERERFSWTSPT